MATAIAEVWIDPRIGSAWQTSQGRRNVSVVSIVWAATVATVTRLLYPKQRGEPRRRSRG